MDQSKNLLKQTQVSATKEAHISVHKHKWINLLRKSCTLDETVIRRWRWRKECHLWLVSAFESQSMAWSRPSPLVADVLKIWKVRFLRASSPSAWCTSATLRAPSMSCLLARTTSTAPFNSSSWIINNIIDASINFYISDCLPLAYTLARLWRYQFCLDRRSLRRK